MVWVLFGSEVEYYSIWLLEKNSLLFVCVNGQDKKLIEEVLVVGEAFVCSSLWQYLRHLTVSSKRPFCKWTQAVVFLTFSYSECKSICQSTCKAYKTKCFHSIQENKAYFLKKKADKYINI